MATQSYCKAFRYTFQTTHAAKSTSLPLICISQIPKSLNHHKHTVVFVVEEPSASLRTTCLIQQRFVGGRWYSYQLQSCLFFPCRNVNDVLMTFLHFNQGDFATVYLFINCWLKHNVIEKTIAVHLLYRSSSNTV